MIIDSCNLKMFTGREITITKVGNEMDIFISLIKYNSRRQREEGTACSIVYNVFIRNGIYPLRLIGTVYKEKKHNFVKIK